MARDKVVTSEPVPGSTWDKYRKKPVVISARQMPVPFKVETLEGWLEGKPGDWLIEGVKGELYPCADDVFQLTYEAVDE